MSVRLASGANMAHVFMDDLEPCFWVLLWQAIHFFESDATAYHPTMFNEYKNDETSGEMTGGAKKWHFLLSRSKRVTFTCRPLNDLVEKFGNFLRTYYCLHEQPEKQLALFHDPSPDVLRFFYEALASQDWPEADAIPDCYAPGQRRKHRNPQQYTSSSSYGELSDDTSKVPRDASLPVLVSAPQTQRSRKRRLGDDKADERPAVNMNGRSAKRTKIGRSLAVALPLRTDGQPRRTRPARSCQTAGEQLQACHSISNKGSPTLDEVLSQEKAIAFVCMKCTAVTLSTALVRMLVAEGRFSDVLCSVSRPLFHSLYIIVIIHTPNCVGRNWHCDRLHVLDKNIEQRQIAATKRSRKATANRKYICGRDISYSCCRQGIGTTGWSGYGGQSMRCGIHNGCR